MSDTVNAVVNNLANRFSEVVEVVSPAMERVGEISQTVVQETANSGFVYTMVGIGMVGIACVAILGIIRAMRRIVETSQREIVIGWLVAAASIFTIVGFVVVLGNLTGWIAPTRHVVLDVITKI